MKTVKTKTVYAVGVVVKAINLSIGLQVELKLGDGGCGVLPVFESEVAVEAYCRKRGIEEVKIIPIQIAAGKGGDNGN